MVFLLVVVALCTVAGIGLLVAMFRRDEPVLGTAGLTVLLVAGVFGTVYGLLTSS